MTPLRCNRSAVFTTLALVVALTAPAGAQQPPGPRYKLITARNVIVPMTGGTRLAIDIYRPDAPGAFAALGERTSCDKVSRSGSGVSFGISGAGFPFVCPDRSVQPQRIGSLGAALWWTPRFR